MRYISLIICVGFLILSKYIPKYKKIFIVLSAGTLLAFWGIRGNIFNGIYSGVDYNSYKNWFNIIEQLPLSLIINDIGFNVLMLIIKKVTNCFELFIFLSTAFFIYSIYKYAIDHNKEYLLTIYLFISFGIFELGLTAIRQWMAGSVFLLSIKYIRDQKLWKYLICILIASLFHNSAIILIILYPFVNIKKDKHILKIIICGIVGIIATILIKQGILIDFIYKIAPLYAQKHQNLGSELNANYTVFIISTAILSFIMINRNTYNYIKEKYNYQLSYLILLCLFAFLATQNFMINRMLQYFMPAIPLVVPNVLDTIENKKIKNLMIVCTICFFLAIYIL